jgi:hypothetical protein
MKLITLFLIISTHICSAAFEKTESSAASFAIGNAMVAVPFSFTAIYYNPATLDTGSSLYTQMSARNFYGFKEIYQFDFILGFKLSNSPLCFSVSRFGNPKYQEIQFALATAFCLTNDFYIGLGIQSYFLSISGYGADYSYGVNLGILYKIDDNVYWGAMISNINQPTIGKNSEALPQCFSLGICYYPQKRLTISAEIFRDIRFESDYRMGVAYQFQYPIIIRIGLQDAVNSYCLGLGFVWNTFWVDYALQIHQILGESHIFSIAIQL